MTDEDLESAWEAARDVLDAEVFDAAARDALLAAAAVLRRSSHDHDRARLARIIEGIVQCHVETEAIEATQAAVEELLEEDWPLESTGSRVRAVVAAVGLASMPTDGAIVLAEQGIAVGENHDDAEARALTVALLGWLADAIARTSPERRAALLRRIVDEFEEVPGAVEDAEAQLADPYYKGLALAAKPGNITAAERAFRQAIDAGLTAAWLELAATLAAQPGREDDEEQALRAALEDETQERATFAAYLLGCLLRYVRNDHDGARAAFGRATTGTGPHALRALRELVILAAIERDHEARRSLLNELLGRSLLEWDNDARDKTYRTAAAASRFGYARPFNALHARSWHRERRKLQQRGTIEL